MKKETSLVKNTGSVDVFDREWEIALTSQDGRYLIYPCDHPVKQFDLFESIKIARIEKLLQKSAFSGSRTLEYGCGAAGISIYLANRGYDTYICDLSQNALKVALLNEHRHQDINRVYPIKKTIADIFKLPYQSNSFDMVMSYGLLEHFEPALLSEVLAEIIRTLRPGGLFLADIAHGRLSMYTLGIWTSMLASMLVNLVSMRWRKLSSIPDAYLEHYYENKIDDRKWKYILQSAGLAQVEVMVCHPYPPLALSGKAEQVYTSLLSKMRPAWNWYHETQPVLFRNLGWLYLACGIKM